VTSLFKEDPKAAGHALSSTSEAQSEASKNGFIDAPREGRHIEHRSIKASKSTFQLTVLQTLLLAIAIGEAGCSSEGDNTY